MAMMILHETGFTSFDYKWDLSGFAGGWRGARSWVETMTSLDGQQLS